MEWLVIIGLGGWAWLQSRQLGKLRSKLDELERLVGALAADATIAARKAAAAVAQPPITETAPGPVEASPAPEPAVAELEPLLLTQVVPPDELALDTPVPATSNDPVPALADEPAALPPVAEPPQPEPVKPPLGRPRPPARKLDQWLAENGLAWLGGGLAALGAIYLVSVATQQSWFTPFVQLMCAVALGLALLGASEWARRVSKKNPPGHPLVAAMLAGAGIVAFYATTWAAHGLYGMIGWGWAATLLTLCAAALIGLSYLHGQALGVLAVLAALLAPALTHQMLWPSAAVTLYVCAAGATGYGLAGLRRWPWVAAATLAGLYFWFAAAIAVDEVRRALSLLSLASLGAALLPLRPGVEEIDKGGRLSWDSARTLGPSVAICISSVLLIWAWLAMAAEPSGRVAGPALIGVFHVALAAYAVRSRSAVPNVFAIAVGGLLIGFIAYLRWRQLLGPLGDDFYAVILGASMGVAFFALAAHPHHAGRVLVAAAGAIGAAALSLLAAFSRPEWHSLPAWSALFGGAVILLLAALRTAQYVADPKTDRAIDFWAGAAGALALIGVESAFAAELRPIADAGAALVFSAAYMMRGWRMLRLTALGAATLALTHALSPSFTAASFTGLLPLWTVLLILGGGAALLFGAARFAARRAALSTTDEALSTVAILFVITAVVHTLHWLMPGGAGTPISSFTENALRALTLMVAGFIVMPRAAQETGRIAAWRGHVLVGLGLLYFLLGPGVATNPWWGDARHSIINGPPIFNALALAFAAPAVIAFAAANRLYARQRLPARLLASAGGVLMLLWAVLEVRHAFHGADMAAPHVGLFEAACYALVLLSYALLIALVARARAARGPDRPFTQDLGQITRGSAWAGVAGAAFILLVLRHPVWGAQDPATTNAFSTLLASLAQAPAIVLAFLLARALSVSNAMDTARFAAASAGAVFTWSFGHSVIRWFYQRGFSDDAVPLISLEGYVQALWPLALVIGASAVTARAPGRDTNRHYLYDLQAVWAAAIWPALAFAGLGFWVLFNPWWGVWPGRISSAFAAVDGLVLSLLVAWLSAMAMRVPHARWPEWLKHAATVACVFHLLVAMTLTVRWLYHREGMVTAAATDVELWIYSAAWALFGAGVFALGMRRNDAALRWSGIAILLSTTAYVFFLTFTRLTGVIRALSVIGLSVVLLAVAWGARTYKPALRTQGAPGDLLLNVSSSARRDRRPVRRRK